MSGFWQTLDQADRLATLEINSWHSAVTDPVWAFFSDIPVWIPLYVAIIVFLIYRLGWKKGLVAIAAAGLAFAFCDQSSNLLKAMTERLRPCNDPYMLAAGLHILESGGKFGFFSAHAANAFGLATSTFLCLRMDEGLKYRGYACGMYIWALMVSVSRVFVGKHYLGDVIVGICVGLFAGWVSACLARYLVKRFLA